MSWQESLPVLVAAGQRTWRDRDVGRTPVDALHEVASLALEDSNTAGLLEAIDTVATVRFITDTNPDLVSLFPRNPGKLLAQRLGIDAAAYFQGSIGGNTPQYLVNHFANMLAAGEAGTVLLTGVELLDSFFSALKTGGDISAWSGEPCASPETIGIERDGLNAIEQAHGLFEPVNTYPLFENALSHHLGKSTASQMEYVAQLCSQMSIIASKNQHAWRQQALSPEDIATVTAKNRYIGYPYTRAMNPVLAVDTAAAVIVTTAGKARELGIDPSQFVYLSAGTDVNDIWYVSERDTLYESPAIRYGVSAVLDHAAITLDDIDHFDLYSCFPSAVQIACREIGLSPLDSRGVTVTGGLPYFGGPGNNYSLHAIAEMVEELRGDSSYGLVTANGLYLTKHSIGLYSTTAPDRAAMGIDSQQIQNEIEKGPRKPLAKDPVGAATVESFTVAFDRDGPKKGFIVALNNSGERIIANTDAESDVLEAMLSQNPIGLEGTVVSDGDLNLFKF